MENRYSDASLVDQKVAAQHHRQFIGGMWDEIGKLQLDFMQGQGLLASDRLLDVGCGCFRGGVHFIEYLDAFGYYGFDLNRPLIDAGLEIEVPKLGLESKIDRGNFHASEGFQYPEEWRNLDVAIGLSLFTHLTVNSITQCLFKTRKLMKTGGRFYATIFEVRANDANGPVEQAPGIVSHPDKDPYHYTQDDMWHMANKTGWKFVTVQGFHHPRNQRMAVFEAS